ncbi:MAG: lipopolysaccharide heptosyltransferase II [Candidatus Omnitrophota bacterium]
MGPNILIVNVNWLGDVLFSTPAIRALRKKFPEATLACLAPPRCAEVLRRNPHLNDVIICPDEDSVLSWPRLAATFFELRKKRFDTAIFFHRSKTKVFMAWLAGVPERIGYRVGSRIRFLTKSVPEPGTPLHRTDYFLRLLRDLGIPEEGRTPDFVPSKEAEAQAEALLADEGVAKRENYVVVHPGGNWDLKRWPVSHFVEWTRLFRKEFPHKVLVCGTPAETGLSAGIKSHFKDNGVVSLCGKTSLDVLAVLLRGAKLLLSNDSGPIHLAASQRTPIVGVFGPTSDEETGPLSEGGVRIVKKDVGCQIPCYFRACDTRVCMDWLTPEEVFKKTKELLGEAAR